MTWILVAVALGVAGTAVVGVAAARAAAALSALNREISHVHQHFRSKGDLRG